MHNTPSPFPGLPLEASTFPPRFLLVTASCFRLLSSSQPASPTMQCCMRTANVQHQAVQHIAVLVPSHPTQQNLPGTRHLGIGIPQSPQGTLLGSGTAAPLVGNGIPRDAPQGPLAPQAGQHPLLDHIVPSSPHRSGPGMHARIREQQLVWDYWNARTDMEPDSTRCA